MLEFDHVDEVLERYRGIEAVYNKYRNDCVSGDCLTARKAHTTVASKYYINLEAYRYYSLHCEDVEQGCTLRDQLEKMLPGMKKNMLLAERIALEVCGK